MSDTSQPEGRQPDASKPAPRIPLLVLDALLVIAFAALGRASHHEGLAPLDVLGTALPFLGALAIAWLIVTLTGMRPHRVWPAGVVIWLVTVSSGLALRVLFGQTAALPFMLVTTGVLAVLLLLPRLVWQIVQRRRASASTGGPA